jgi:FixJ family two-component response regulator
MKSRQPLIFVVEDDADMSRAMESMLSAAGFDTAVHASAECLLATGVPAAAACLLLDVHLPGMSGFELQERLATPGLPAGRVHDGARRTRRAGAFVSGRRAEPA